MIGYIDREKWNVLRRIVWIPFEILPVNRLHFNLSDSTTLFSTLGPISSYVPLSYLIDASKYAFPILCDQAHS